MEKIGFLLECPGVAQRIHKEFTLVMEKLGFLFLSVQECPEASTKKRLILPPWGRGWGHSVETLPRSVELHGASGGPKTVRVEMNL